jgi:hypothetical protein
MLSGWFGSLARILPFGEDGKTAESCDVDEVTTKKVTSTSVNGRG